MGAKFPITPSYLRLCLHVCLKLVSFGVPFVPGFQELDIFIVRISFYRLWSLMRY